MLWAAASCCAPSHREEEERWKQNLSLNTDQLLLSVLAPTCILAGGEGPSTQGRDAAIIGFSLTPSTPPTSFLAPVTSSLKELGQK